MRKDKRPESNGSKVATCVRCKGEIQPYAGRSVALIRGQYAHQPGRCKDQAQREAAVHELAGQGSLFAWRCDRVELGDVTGTVCAESGTDRAEYVAHMADHGKRLPSGAAKIRLRKSAPGASLPKLEVSPFKWLRWTERVYAEWQAGIGNELLSERERRGQFWAEADGPHCYWYLPFDASDRQPVRLYARGDGTLTPDWSEARRARSDANRRAKRHGLAA